MTRLLEAHVRPQVPYSNPPVEPQAREAGFGQVFRKGSRLLESSCNGRYEQFSGSFCLLCCEARQRRGALRILASRIRTDLE